MLRNLTFRLRKVKFSHYYLGEILWPRDGDRSHYYLVIIVSGSPVRGHACKSLRGLTLFLFLSATTTTTTTPRIGHLAWVGLPLDSLESSGSLPVDSLESIGSAHPSKNDHWVCFC